MGNLGLRERLSFLGIVFPAMLLALAAPRAQGGAESGGTPDRPDFGVGRSAGCFFAGGAAGALLGGAAALAGSNLFHDENDQDDISGGLGGIFGGLTGYILGTSIGTYWAGNLGDMSGSYRAALGGSVLGFAAGGLGFLAAERWFSDSNNGANDELNGALFFAGPPLGATIAFALTRRYDRPAEPPPVSLARGGWTREATTARREEGESRHRPFTMRFPLIRLLR